MVNPNPVTQSNPRPFVKIFWEIHFFPTKDLESAVTPSEVAKPTVNMLIPQDVLPSWDAQFLLKMMSVFHSASTKLVEELLKQAKSLKDFTEKDADQNFEIAKMITWIKLLQEMIERLKSDIS